eukprot:5785725-Prymnesium_polylepis.1
MDVEEVLPILGCVEWPYVDGRGGVGRPSRPLRPPPLFPWPPCSLTAGAAACGLARAPGAGVGVAVCAGAHVATGHTRAAAQGERLPSDPPARPHAAFGRG